MQFPSQFQSFFRSASTLSPLSSTYIASVFQLMIVVSWSFSLFIALCASRAVPLVTDWNDDAIRFQLASHTWNSDYPGVDLDATKVAGSHTAWRVVPSAMSSWEFWIGQGPSSERAFVLTQVTYAGSQRATLQLSGLQPTDLIVGLGEHQLLTAGHRLNMRGNAFNYTDCTNYNVSHGGQVCIPHLSVVRNNRIFFSFFLNSPSYGAVSLPLFGEFDVVFDLEVLPQIDIVVSTTLNGLTQAIGMPAPMPSWALGYWHSKLRYKTQAELLEAAAEFHRFEIPVSVIVIDYLHWKLLGDWSFDPKFWPDPSSMVEQITGQYGISKVMVSVWPFSQQYSATYNALRAFGYGTKPLEWDDSLCFGAPCLLYDPFQPAARAELWNRLTDGYVKHNISLFWLDAAEPEIVTPESVRANAVDSYGEMAGRPGSGHSAQAVGMAFPLYHGKTIQNGLRSLGQDSVYLIRSAWAGTSAQGGILWSGDTQSNWATLQVSVPTALGAQLSGITWWTTDIGGFNGGDPSSDEFGELLARWFQFGLTCPIFRQHGNRNTEPWKLGSHPAYTGVVRSIRLRYEEPLKSHIAAVSAEAAATGTPIMRPLWWHAPLDPSANNTAYMEQSYWWGADYFMRPVTEPGVDSVLVYFPLYGDPVERVTYQCFFTNTTYLPGNKAHVPVTLDTFPLFRVNRY